MLNLSKIEGMIDLPVSDGCLGFDSLASISISRGLEFALQTLTATFVLDISSRASQIVEGKG